LLARRAGPWAYAVPSRYVRYFTSKLPRLAHTLRAVGLLAGVTASRAAYASDDLQVECPELERERVAEIESRARASLLLNSFAERVAITCEGDDVLVEASAGASHASVHAPAAPVTLVDDVLAAVDQALEQLRVPKATPPSPEAAPVSPSPSPSGSRPQVPRAPVMPFRPRAPATAEPVPAQVARSAHAPARRFTLLAAAAGLEAWSNRTAAGLVIAARYGRAPLWAGLNGSVFRPLRQDARFQVTELSLAATVTLEPAFGHGLCLTLQAGPSWLWTVPDPALAVHGHTLGASFAGGAELNWPIWRGRTGIMPGLGVRWFRTERGVRIDQSERFALKGLAPNVTLAVVHRID